MLSSSPPVPAALGVRAGTHCCCGLLPAQPSEPLLVAVSCVSSSSAPALCQWSTAGVSECAAPGMSCACCFWSQRSGASTTAPPAYPGRHLCTRLSSWTSAQLPRLHVAASTRCTGCSRLPVHPFVDAQKGPSSCCGCIGCRSHWLHIAPACAWPRSEAGEQQRGRFRPRDRWLKSFKLLRAVLGSARAYGLLSAGAWPQSCFQQLPAGPLTSPSRALLHCLPSSICSLQVGCVAWRFDIAVVSALPSLLFLPRAQPGDTESQEEEQDAAVSRG